MESHTEPLILSISDLPKGLKPFSPTSSHLTTGSADETQHQHKTERSESSKRVAGPPFESYHNLDSDYKSLYTHTTILIETKHQLCQATILLLDFFFLTLNPLLILLSERLSSVKKRFELWILESVFSRSQGQGCEDSRTIKNLLCQTGKTV
ncbi:unnamed protein product [Lactuca virosa]|uniref:Uncharacterized protein n=1 Tax=Lactuca virosa TaxID=75947 RepID=A0AAU9P4R0_9ASTR|nr:unnamed protein product [Lactuca virosa]